MNKLIDFINLCVLNPLLPLSWGIGNIIVGRECVSFFVNGSKFQGKVVIESRIGSLKIVIGEYEEIFTDVKDAFSWLDLQIE